MFPSSLAWKGRITHLRQRSLFTSLNFTMAFIKFSHRFLKVFVKFHTKDLDSLIPKWRLLPVASRGWNPTLFPWLFPTYFVRAPCWSREFTVLYDICVTPCLMALHCLEHLYTFEDRPRLRRRNLFNRMLSRCKFFECWSFINWWLLGLGRLITLRLGTFVGDHLDCLSWS